MNLFLFMDDIFSWTFYKRYSASTKLNQIILWLRILDVTYCCMFYMLHMVAMRMNKGWNEWTFVKWFPWGYDRSSRLSQFHTVQWRMRKIKVHSKNDVVWWFLFVTSFQNWRVTTFQQNFFPIIFRNYNVFGLWNIIGFVQCLGIVCKC